MAARRKVLTAHVPWSLEGKLDAMAARPESSQDWVMKQAIAAGVDQEEEHHRMTLEALDDVDAGRVIDHLVVRAWVDSLGADMPVSPPRS